MQPVQVGMRAVLQIMTAQGGFIRQHRFPQKVKGLQVFRNILADAVLVQQNVVGITVVGHKGEHGIVIQMFFVLLIDIQNAIISLERM